MRFIINYIRSCFCKHDWELIADAKIYSDDNDKYPHSSIKIYRCKKCGYSKKYKI